MPPPTAEQAAAIRLAIDCIMDAARIGGDLGAPSGVIYAAMAAQGMTLDVYQQLVDYLVRKNRITLKYNLIRLAA